MMVTGFQDRGGACLRARGWWGGGAGSSRQLHQTRWTWRSVFLSTIMNRVFRQRAACLLSCPSTGLVGWGVPRFVNALRPLQLLNVSRTGGKQVKGRSWGPLAGGLALRGAAVCFLALEFQR